MSGDINLNLDLASTVDYFSNKVLGIFGKDSTSREFEKQFREEMKLSVANASYVQCVGMYKPVPIRDIYQHTRLTLGNEPATVEHLLDSHQNAIVLAKPGEGKTTFLHWLFLSNLNSPKWLPILITLRKQSSRVYLQALFEQLKRGYHSRELRKHRLLLLIDGYDEISEDERKELSELLLRFSVFEHMQFVLTCREFYEIYELKAPRFEIAPFERIDALHYVDAFGKAYVSQISAESLIQELDARQFGSFWAHPLLLALICVLRSRKGELKAQELPKSSIGLIRRALDTLAFRWDEEKGIDRKSVVDIDGEDRIRCLMQVAYLMSSPIEAEHNVARFVRVYLGLIQRTDVDPRTLLIETAQFFGVFVPVGEMHWTFTHKTIYDYLAARMWVESGKFKATDVTTFNSKSAYAACLSPDATTYRSNALVRSFNLHAFVECLYNNAPYRPEPLAVALEGRFEMHGKNIEYVNHVNHLTVKLEEDFMKLVSNELLIAMVARASGGRSRAKDILVASALGEIASRNEKIGPKLCRQLLDVFRVPNYGFTVRFGNRTIDFALNEVFGDATSPTNRLLGK
jgi:hypothetical protein